MCNMRSVKLKLKGTIISIAMGWSKPLTLKIVDLNSISRIRSPVGITHNTWFIDFVARFEAFVTTSASRRNQIQIMNRTAKPEKCGFSVKHSGGKLGLKTIVCWAWEHRFPNDVHCARLHTAIIAPPSKSTRATDNTKLATPKSLQQGERHVIGSIFRFPY